MYHWSKVMTEESEGEVCHGFGSEGGRRESSSGGFIELVSQPRCQAVEVEPGVEDIRLLIGAGVCVQLRKLPSPEYLAMLAHRYDGVSS